MNLQGLLRKGIADTNFYFLAQVGSRLVGLAVIPIFARLLTVEEFAAYDLFILSSSFVVLIAGLGIDSGSAILIAENREDKTVLRNILSTTLSLNLFAISILWSISVGLWYLGGLGLDFDISLVHGLFLYTLVYQYNYSVYNFIRWLGNAKTASLINFFSYVLMVAGGLSAIVTLGPSAANYITGAIAGGCLGGFFTSIQARGYLRFGFLPITKTRELMSLSLPYVPTYLSNYLMQFVDRLLITSYFGLGTLGLYSLVNRVGQVVTFSLQIASNGFRPIITANYSNANGLALGRLIYNVYCASTIPVCVIAVVASPFIVSIFGGEKYSAARPILPLIVVSVWFLGTFFLTGYGYQIKRKTIFITVITLSVVGLIYVLGLIFIQFTGPIGIAQASVVASAAGALGYMHFSEKLYRFGYNKWYMIISFLASILIVFAATWLYG